jgi:hypothetical protein
MIMHDPVTGEVILRVHTLPNGLIAVDIETTKALFFASKFLPATPAIVDRPGKPKSRWLYKSSATRGD